MFAYPDAARYRVGTNYQQLPTNAAKAPVHCPYQRDGQMNFSDNYGSDPNYVGSSLKPMTFYQDVSSRSPQTLSTITEHEKWVGEVCSFQNHITEDDFVQPRELWKVIGREPGHQERFFGNVAGHLSKVKSEKLRNAVYGRSLHSFYGSSDQWLKPRQHSSQKSIPVSERESKRLQRIVSLPNDILVYWVVEVQNRFEPCPDK